MTDPRKLPGWGRLLADAEADVADWPPLTAQQKNALAALLRPVREAGDTA